MRTHPLLPCAALAAAALALLPLPAQSQDYFIPGQPKQQVAPRAVPRPVPRPAQPAEVGAAGLPPAEEPPPTLREADLPPLPDVPTLPKGEAPPAATMGVLDVQEVVLHSSAGQQLRDTIGQRREKLQEDAQKEQQSWRDTEQTLANDRSKLSVEQVRTRERALQERVATAQRKFRERARIIQEAGQYAEIQIRRVLSLVVQRVAESRGMNLVLQRPEVALNANGFDITPAVTAEFNKVMPKVIIPADGVTVAEMVAAARREAAKETAKKPATASAPAAATGGAAAPKP